MGIEEFIKRYGNDNDLFKRDLWSVIDNLSRNDAQWVAMEVLTNTPNATLELYDNSDCNGVISFRNRRFSREAHQGAVVNYSKAIGLQGCDWIYLLKILSAEFIRRDV